MFQDYPKQLIYHDPAAGVPDTFVASPADEARQRLAGYILPGEPNSNAYAASAQISAPMPVVMYPKMIAGIEVDNIDDETALLASLAAQGVQP